MGTALLEFMCALCKIVFVDEDLGLAVLKNGGVVVSSGHGVKRDRAKAAHVGGSHQAEHFGAVATKLCHHVAALQAQVMQFGNQRANTLA